MYAPRALARFNRHVTNPIQRRWAGVIPLHGIIEHTGRRSGRTYRTPVLCFRAPGGGGRVVFVVGYGLQSDWMRNLLAAGGGGLEHRRRRYRLEDVELVRAPDGRALLPAPMRLLTGVMGIGDVLTARITPAG
ncbi:MAG: nitroreductase family deazaflavin-dependent oxidoreductase [Nocardioidaceae bacterium]|nr:nitroreductase family deazaflavin-dependent oxidoreductase [Nocardioidaceae bacterium]MCL2613667.1 nitroreductase family deazaflavin-dependent oxidoreductase [Nocardioidaceae bacterium]